eukprot:12729608-Alexandrium_andersonii.AAC.1
MLEGAKTTPTPPLSQCPSFQNARKTDTAPELLNAPAGRSRWSWTVKWVSPPASHYTPRTQWAFPTYTSKPRGASSAHSATSDS